MKKLSAFLAAGTTNNRGTPSGCSNEVQVSNDVGSSTSFRLRLRLPRRTPFPSSSGGGAATPPSKPKKPLSAKNVKLYAGVGLLLICVLAVVLGGGGDEPATADAAKDGEAKKEE